MKRLSPQMSRFLAVALLVVAVVLPYRLVVVPLQETYREYAETAATQQDLLDRYRRLADSRAALRARLEELQVSSTSQEGYLTGDSETLVAAELQNLVRTTVERNGARLESTQILPAVNEGEFVRVTLRVRMAADTAALFRSLYDLESTTPYLFLQNIDIVAREGRGRRQAEIAAAQAESLTVSYDVYGYMRAV